MKGNTVEKTTVIHTVEHEGMRFTDTYGRTYVYTSMGLIYDTIK